MTIVLSDLEQEPLGAVLARAQQSLRQGLAQAGLDHGLAALQRARGEPDMSAWALACRISADACLALSRYPEALGHYLEGLSLYRTLADQRGQSDCLQGIGAVDMYIGDYAQALERLDEALLLCPPGLPDETEAMVRHRLGMVHARVGELAQAREYYEQALKMRRQIGDTAMIASSLNSLGVLCLRTGDQCREVESAAAAQCFIQAKSYFRETLKLAGVVGDRHLRALALTNFASALANLGELEQALPIFREQLEAVRALHDRYDEALCLGNIGEALRLLQRPAEALAVLEDALQIGIELQSKTRLKRAHMELSKCQEALGNAAQALHHYKEYHRIEQALRVEQASSKARDLAVSMAVAKIRQEADFYRDQRDRLAADNQRLDLEANLDALTGVANRRFLDARLPQLCASAARNGQALCLALLDIDHFKRVNDNYSHMTGDQVLRALGAILQQQSRPADMVARYGGEEFALIFVNTELAEALVACERLRAVIEAYPWGQIAGGLSITASMGVAQTQGDMQLLLKEADRLLYRAKDKGRNRVCGSV